MSRPLVTVLLVAAAVCPCPGAPQVVFDYSYDAGGYFDPAKRAVLDLAADCVNRFVDDLAALVPSGGNTWDAWVTDPATGVEQLRSGSTMGIGTDVIRIFVAGRNLGSGTGTLAVTYSKAPVAQGDADWVELVKSRGQSNAYGSSATDFGPWGGSISFNSSTNWYAGTDSEGLGSQQYDLLSVATHEVMHVLGVGPADSWKHYRTYDPGQQTGWFDGPQAVASYGGNVPLADLAHWAAGVVSTVAGNPQSALMCQVMPVGARLLATEVDRAALGDIGWRPALAGDVNRDSQVDTDDILGILLRGSLDSGHDGHGWSDGDFTGDGYVDTDDILAILLGGGLGAGHYASMGSNPGHNRMIYNPTTGNVTLDTTVAGANVTGFKLLDALADGKSVWAGAEKAAFPPGALSTTDNDTTVSYASVSGGFSPGVWDLGNIALLGLTESELLETFSTADTYYLDASQGNIKQDWDLVVVPEPGALALLTLGGLAALWRRRRVPARFPTTPQLSPTSARGAGIRPRRRYAAGGCGSASAPARIRSSIRLPASRATT